MFGDEHHAVDVLAGRRAGDQVGVGRTSLGHHVDPPPR